MSDSKMKSSSEVSFSSGLVANSSNTMGVEVGTHYKIECFGPNGNLKWVEEFDNLVTTAGLNKLLDATLKTGLASPAWYVGLKGTGTPVAGDTMASHGSWSEIVPYSDATRPAFTPGTIASGSVSNSASKAVFNANATSTVYGCFLVDVSTKSGTTGNLYGSGDFASSRAVVSGDILNVTVTASITAS